VAHVAVAATGTLESTAGAPVLQYEVAADGRRLTLWNELGTGEMNVPVNCTARGADGTEASRELPAYFEGPTRVWEEGYTERVGACLRAHLKDLKGLLATPPTGGIGRIGALGGSLFSAAAARAAVEAAVRGGVVDPLALRSVALATRALEATLPQWLQAAAPPLATAAAGALRRAGP
jgi:hypothetical protein